MVIADTKKSTSVCRQVGPIRCCPKRLRIEMAQQHAVAFMAPTFAQTSARWVR